MAARRPALALAGALSAALAGAAAPGARAQLFAPETFTLDNGLRGIVVARERAPVVSHSLWYRVGAMDEPAGQTGLAHFTEHLMFKGTKTNPGNSYHRTIAGVGGQSNAFTSHDVTAYLATVKPEHLETVMKLEADRMAHLRLSQKAVKRERQVIVQERRQVVEGDPAGLLGETMRASLFLNHPYRRPVVGWLPEIKQLDKAQVTSWYERWYAPNNAVLVVVGDTDLATVKKLARRHYGQRERRDVPARRSLVEPQPPAPRRVSLRDGRVGKPQLMRRYLAPSATSGKTALAPALRLLATILSGGDANRLQRSLVLEQGLAASAGGGYSPLRRGPATFRLSATAAGDTRLAELASALDAELADLKANGVSQETLEGAKAEVKQSAVFARDGLGGAARLLGKTAALGLELSYVENLVQRLEAVTAAEVQEAARLVFQPNRRVSGYLRPAAEGGAE